MFLEIFRQLHASGCARPTRFDFDDLIAQTVYLFRAFPKVAALYQRRFRHILVDEYQDTNHAQYSLIRELTRSAEMPRSSTAHGVLVTATADDHGPIPGASLTVVGDSDQSIYAFRGADIRNIVEFERDFPSSKVILLEQNYRSTQNILERGQLGHLEQLRPQGQEAVHRRSATATRSSASPATPSTTRRSSLPTRSSRLHEAGMAYKDIAVFYRTNAQTRALEDIFIRSAMPYRVLGGTKFYERAEIKDVMAYLIAVANPARRAGVAPHPERAQARHRPGHRGGRCRATPSTNEHRSCARRCAQADELGLGPKVTGAMLDLGAILDEARCTYLAEVAAGHGAKVADMLSAIARADRVLDACCAQQPRPARRGPRRERRGAPGADQGVRARATPRARCSTSSTEVSLVAAADETRRLAVGHRLADDAAHRQGPRVRRRVPHRHRGGAAAAPDVGGRARRPGRRAAAVLRRHHPRAQAAVPLARDDAGPVRRGERGHADAFLQEIPGRADRLETPVARHGELFAAAGSLGSSRSWWLAWGAGTADRDLERHQQSLARIGAVKHRAGQAGAGRVQPTTAKSSRWPSGDKVSHTELRRRDGARASGHGRAGDQDESPR